MLPWVWLVVFFWCISALGAEKTPVPLLPCRAGASDLQCNPSPHDLKEAASAFSRGLKLEKGSPDAAYQEFQHAAELAPRNLEYLTAREAAKQELVYNHIQRGNTELLAGKQIEALADFRAAASLDPGNGFAQQRMKDAVSDPLPKTAATPSVVEESPEIRVAPSEGPASFHFRGDSKELLSEVTAIYGIAAQLDDSVPSRHVRFDVDNVNFFQAMRAAGDVTKTFWSPLGASQILVALDTPANRRNYERLAMRTFYLPGITTAAQMTEIVNLLRIVFDIRYVNPSLANSTLMVRAPQNSLDAATRLIERLDTTRPEVMLDIRVYQVSHTFARSIGLHIPYNFNLFNIPVAALASLGGQNIQDLVNQLIASGGINQAGNTALSALLAQLQGQQNSIFSQPVATFGGGKTLTGVTLDQLSAQLSLNEGWVKTLDQATVRASQGEQTTFQMGSRFPVLNASFAPVFNSAAISQVLQNNSFQAAFPSFTYENLGLTVKTKAAIASDRSIDLELDFNLRALAGNNLNGVPVIGNKEYKGSISLRDGEPAVVAGEVDQSDMRNLTGVPGISQIPGLKQLTGVNDKQLEYDELLVVITPHIARRNQGENTVVYLPR